jgi:hypothetical protein
MRAPSLPTGLACPVPRRSLLRMAHPTRLRRRFGPALSVGAALVANLLAASVPLVHALAHAHHERHAEKHVRGASHAPLEHGTEHEQIHPEPLHDDWLAQRGAELGPAIAPIRGAPDQPTVVRTAPTLALESVLHARAPPRAPPARARLTSAGRAALRARYRPSSFFDTT